MKRQLLAGMAALILLLTTGCSALLSRQYAYVTAHNATTPTAEGDPSILRAESYQELVNALIYFINQGIETGTIRLYMDSQVVETDLENACLEVVQEDALGAYAVEYIKYSVNSVVTYNQADVQIAYRRSKEQVASIVSVTGITAIRNELTSALAAFDPEQVLRISYFDGDEDYIRTLVREAYYATPETALGMPQTQVFIYPDSGQQRIVEILLSYPLETQELERRREELSQWLDQLYLPHSPNPLLTAAQAVLQAGSYLPSGGNTAYDVLLQGAGNSEGLALAMALVCQSQDLPCQVVEGSLAEQPHFWTVVETEAGWRHLDITMLQTMDDPFLTDQECSARGYVWDSETVPACQ